MNEQNGTKREEGQSLIVIGALLIVLVALIGLVVDVGNAYAQRRIVQNAVDAAALAGSQKLVHQEDYLSGGQILKNSAVIQTVEDYAERNGVNPNELAIYYTDINGNILKATDDLGWDDPITPDTFGGTRAEGIRVDGDRAFATYLVRILGRTDMVASASSQGVLACGACSAGGGEGLFPIAVPVNLFDDTEGRPVLGREYRVFEKVAYGHWQAQGGFGWLSWNQDPGHVGANSVLVENMRDTTRSGSWSVGDWVPTSTGFENCHNCREELQYRIDNRIDLFPTRPATVTLPIYDVRQGTGQNMTYHIVGFGRFRLNCYHMSNGQKYGSCQFQHPDNSHWISGVFVKWVESTGESGCTNYGVCTAKLRQPLEENRAIVGNVIPWRVLVERGAVPANPAPVDIVHVIDISGSMCDHWDGSNHRNPPCTNGERIQVAKDVLTNFNERLAEAEWDPLHQSQVGVASYPKITNSYTYWTTCYQQIMEIGGVCNGGSDSDCTSRANAFYFANKDENLTTSISSVNATIHGLRANGGTSMPQGLQYGRELLTDPDYHDPDNLPILILTTDGMANIDINGRATGYLGNYTRPWWIVESGCNDSVYSSVVEQANQAKENGAIVFTIGIHENIDTALMQAIASVDTDPSKPHFFQARTGDDFEHIYNTILDRLPTISTEECNYPETPGIGGSATVRLYDDRGNLVATTVSDSAGGFIFDNLEPGTYELRATWTDHSYSPAIVYDVPTWTMGGPPAEDPIWVEVPASTGTVHTDVYLRTDQQFTCE